MWLLMRFFAYLRYSYSMEHQLSQSYFTACLETEFWLQILKKEKKGGKILFFFFHEIGPNV